jgi:adenine-specific DNA-methyltransferase
MPDKPKFETPNLAAENAAKIAEIFPGAVVEGKVNFDLLRSLLGDDVFGDEAYEFTWVGKRKAIAEALKPIRKTLRPCFEESKDWDTTENLYIEGDNLDVLKLLQESYSEKVKIIYIDPPYNTGNDFIYNDKWVMDSERWAKEAGGYDEETGEKLFRNTESGGRFHSDWCSMIYPRLVLGRNLLTADGVIFISIDDNEAHNLRKICDEVFGESNFVGQVCRATGTTTGQDANKIGSSLDYLLVYRKSANFTLSGVELSDNDISRFSFEDAKGKYSLLQMRKTGNADRREDRPGMYYAVISPDGKEVFPIGPTGYESRWRFSYDTYQEYLSKDMIVWQNSRSGEVAPYVKYYLDGRTKQVSNLWTELDGNKKGTIELKSVLGKKVFDNPKPTAVLKRILTISNVQSGDIVLDFFSGSSATAQAVMQLNAEDGGKRKFIMVQLPQVCAEGTEAAKAGYKTICDIGKERIRRSGDKIKSDHAVTAPDIDIGFKVFKLGDLQND